MNLQALRQQLGVMQAELAEASGFAQGEISRIEQREDHMVSTRYLLRVQRKFARAQRKLARGQR